MFNPYCEFEWSKFKWDQSWEEEIRLKDILPKLGEVFTESPRLSETI